MRRGIVGAALAALLLALVPAAGAPRPAAGGAIAGRVVFQGPMPKLVNLPVIKDRYVCGVLARSEALVVSPSTRGVQAAVVWVDGVPAPEPAPAPAESRLANRGCRFAPHVLALRAGDDLVIANDDDVLHNLRARLPGRRSAFTVVLPSQGDVARQAIKRAGVMTLTCDTHVHMRAYLLAFDHPYFALTDADGGFRIPGVPPGTYRITVWHEGWTVVGRDPNGGFVYEPPRVVTREVVVPGAGDARLDVDLSASP
jgi:plastocyanin